MIWGILLFLVALAVAGEVLVRTLFWALGQAISRDVQETENACSCFRRLVLGDSSRNQMKSKARPRPCPDERHNYLLKMLGYDTTRQLLSTTGKNAYAVHSHSKHRVRF